MEPVIGSESGLPVTAYREFEPCRALRPHVRALFSFIPAHETRAVSRAISQEAFFRPGDSFCSPLMASAGVSIVFQLGRSCERGCWRASGSPRGEVVGPVTRADESNLWERPAMVGAYLHSGHAALFFDVPARELTDTVWPLADAWQDNANDLAHELAQLDEAARVDRLEHELLRRAALLQKGGGADRVDLAGLAALIMRTRGRVTVDALALSAGVSRQHLRRKFVDGVGVSPKLLCRLARFQAALSVAATTRRDWARVALELGYTDQSHLIAEFREFSSLTPHELATGDWFHPFMGSGRKDSRFRPGPAALDARAADDRSCTDT